MKLGHNIFLRTVLGTFILLSLVLTQMIGIGRVDAQNAFGQAVYYIVLKGNPEGKFEIVHYQEVRLRARLETLDNLTLQSRLTSSPRHKNLIVTSLENAYGKTVYQGFVDTSPWLRGEWSSEGTTQEIDGHMLQTETVVFAVRVPKLPGTQLVLKRDLQNEIQKFDLAEIARSAPRIETNQIGKLSLTETFGAPENRVDLLIMGDGYTNAEEALYNQHVVSLTNGFHNVSPLNEYRNYFNIVSLFNESTESGADHPPYKNPADCPGYDNPSCCTDPEMQGDPLNGEMRNTAFDARYCSYNIHRLLVVDNAKILAEAGNRYPDWDTIAVLVNDTTYGGSGSVAIAVICAYPEASRMLQHEFGHSFGNLADEYDAVYPGYPTCSDTGGNPCEENVTNINSRPNIKWLPWIDPSTPIPTPETEAYRYNVGLFEGARYLTTGMYRSGYLCLMHSLEAGVTFCEVPTQALVLRFYDGGWGDTSERITMLEPGTQIPTFPVNLTHPASVEMKSDILIPQGGPDPLIEWFVDGVKENGAVSNSYTYQTQDTKPGSHIITLHVKDFTPLVKDIMSRGLTVFEHSWTVNVTVNPVIFENITYLPTVFK